MPAEESSSLIWTWDQDKQFERALITYGDHCPNRWEKIAAEVAGKSAEDVKNHYELLREDVSRIESGFVQLPCYSSGSDGSTSHEGKRGGNVGGGGETNTGGKCSKADQERRKGIAWTEDEHRLFLLGLEKYGKGDWRSIARNFVVTRTPTQVASHAQKYFIRLNSMNKDRRRSSIHDITNANTADVVVPQPPITGQTNGTAVGKPKHPQPAAIGGPVYGAPTIGQPIGVSAVGTPVNLPPPTHLAYGVVPGAPMTYPVPHAQPQR